MTGEESVPAFFLHHADGLIQSVDFGYGRGAGGFRIGGEDVFPDVLEVRVVLWEGRVFAGFPAGFAQDDERHARCAHKAFL